MIKPIKFSKYISSEHLCEDKRYLDAEIKVDNIEDAESFLAYLKTRKNSDWWGCLEEFYEEGNTLLIHSNFFFGDMQQRKNQLKEFWYYYCS